MSAIDIMLERNKEFAKSERAAGTLPPSLPEALPHVKALIVTLPSDVRASAVLE